MPDAINVLIDNRDYITYIRIDKSDLQPYFWQTYGPIARYQAKSRDKLVNQSCQLV